MLFFPCVEQLTLIRRVDRIFMRYTASTFGTQQHDMQDSSILFDSDQTKQGQHQNA